jgi:hypothetical protein
MRAAFLLTLVFAHVAIAADVRVSVRSQPTGLSILFDGVPATTPFDRLVPDSSAHQLSAVTPQDFATGSRHAFDRWDTALLPIASPSFGFTVVGASPFPHVYSAVYRTQYAVTLSQIPGGRLVPGPGTTWHDADSSFAIRAIPAAGYSFGEWVGDGEGSYTGTDPAPRLVVRAPIHEHAAFAIDTITTTVVTIPHGLTVAIDGVPHVTPFTRTEEANVGILIDAPETQDAREGAVLFAKWSDGGPRAHMIAPSTDTTYVVTYAPASGQSWISTAWPNPSRDASRFELALAASGPATLVIRDVSGRIVRRLVDGPMEAGIHPIAWDGRDDRGQPVPSGIYFARAAWPGFEGEERLVRLR